ncbi:MAG TPA: hypothetical protein VEK08_02090 [Planctomycetota bacterium]|nr:hypothetical protein [Planctomycetota bacterium]
MEEKSKFPIRFGILDVVAISALIGAQLIYIQHAGEFRPHLAEHQRRLAGWAVIIAALTFGSAYLALRRATEQKMHSFVIRILLVIAIEILIVLAIPVTLALLVLCILFWPLPLCLLVIYVIWRYGKT